MAATLPSVSSVLDQLQSALRDFGEYAFFDKGSQEVMDIDALVKAVRAAEPAEAGAFLRSLAQSWSNAASRLQGAPANVAEAIVLDLQEWDELFEQPGIEDLLNSDVPEVQPGDAPVQAPTALTVGKSKRGGS